MSETRTRSERRAALRADRTGSGPTIGDAPIARFPGATAKFALLGEVLLVGLLVFLVGMLIVTLPAGLAAGIRHLRRHLRAEDSALRHFWTDVRRALAGGAVVGAAILLVSGVLAVDIALAGTGVLPGGLAVQIIGWAGLGAVVVALLAAAGRWSPERGWRAAVRGIPTALRNDVRGAAYLLATGVFVGVATWALPPLLIPALGLTALAVVAIPERRR